MNFPKFRAMGLKEWMTGRDEIAHGDSCAGDESHCGRSDPQSSSEILFKLAVWIQSKVFGIFSLINFPKSHVKCLNTLKLVRKFWRENVQVTE